MPVTPRQQILGMLCNACGGPATHWYGNVPFCCDCHAGQDAGIYSRAAAEALHADASDTEVCPSCAGSGVEPEDRGIIYLCHECGGNGRVPIAPEN